MITSTTNDTVKHLVRLRSRRHRDAEGLFVIEGARPVGMALRAGIEVVALFVTPDLGGALDPGAVPMVEMAEEPFRKASIRQNPDGVMALARHLDVDLSDLEVGESPLVLVVEGIEKPGNLGAILRTADAAGVDALIMCDPTTDVHNPNVVQASTGALFTVPIGVGSVDAALGWLTARSVALVATDPEAESSMWDVDLGGALALAVGSEASGLSRRLLTAASQRVSIPMAGTVDSLNTSVSAALVLYEAVRRRR